jgi:hypothetical protein
MCKSRQLPEIHREGNMASNDDAALGSRALLSVVVLLGTSLVAAAAPGNDTGASAARGSTSDVKTKFAESRRLQNNQTTINPTELQTTGRLAPGTANTLNPQPLPPKAFIGTKKNPGTTQGLNPQPLPPKAFIGAKKNPGTTQGLNPQPLPPKARAGVAPR